MACHASLRRVVLMMLVSASMSRVMPLSRPATSGAAAAPLILTSIHMIDAAVGWATGFDGAILRTDDGGSHWRVVTPLRVSLANAASETAFLSARAARVLIAPGVRVATVIVFSTADAGRTWQRTTFAPERPFTGFRGLTFFDARHGWTLEDVGFGGGYQGVAVFRTVDGGMHWAKVATTCPGRIVHPSKHRWLNGAVVGWERSCAFLLTLATSCSECPPL